MASRHCRGVAARRASTNVWHRGYGVKSALTFPRRFGTQRNLSSSAASTSAGDLSAMVDKLRPLGKGSVELDIGNDSPSGGGSGSAWITVTNEGKKNALSGKMMSELYDAVRTLANDSAFERTTTLYVCGSEDFFCSGADLGVLGGFSKAEGLQMSALMQHTLHELRALPQISIAVVSGGGAMGGGTEFALSTDCRVFGDQAKFQMVQTKLGLVPGWGGGSRLVSLVGRKRAIEVLCSGRRLDSKDCMELGIADAIATPNQSAREAALKFGEQFFNPTYPRAVREAKRLIGFADDCLGMEQALEFERDVFAKVWQGEENLDALAKISAKAKAKRNR